MQSTIKKEWMCENAILVKADSKIWIPDDMEYEEYVGGFLWQHI